MENVYGHILEMALQLQYTYSLLTALLFRYAHGPMALAGPWSG